jgi:hypothetical protein
MSGDGGTNNAFNVMSLDGGHNRFYNFYYAHRSNVTWRFISAGDDWWYLYNVDVNAYFQEGSDGYSALSCTNQSDATKVKIIATGTGSKVYLQTYRYNGQTNKYLGTDATTQGTWIFTNKSSSNNAACYLVPAPVIVQGVNYRLNCQNYLALEIANNFYPIVSGSSLVFNARGASTDNPNASWMLKTVDGSSHEYNLYNVGSGTYLSVASNGWQSNPVSVSDNTVLTGNSYKWSVYPVAGNNYILGLTSSIASATSAEAALYMGTDWYWDGLGIFLNKPFKGTQTSTSDPNSTKGAIRVRFIPQPISYTLSADYGTIVLPFDATIPDGLTVYSCSGVNADTKELTLNQVTTTLEAYKPYIIMGTSGTTYTFEVSSQASIVKTAPYTDSDGFLVGNFLPATVPVSDESNTYYILQYQETQGLAFYHVNSDITAGANRCYLKIPVSAGTPVKAFIFGNTTDISGVKSDTVNNVDVYGIDGRLVRRNVARSSAVNGLTKGIYVAGGKKIVVQ